MKTFIVLFAALIFNTAYSQSHYFLDKIFFADRYIPELMDHSKKKGLSSAKCMELHKLIPYVFRQVGVNAYINQPVHRESMRIISIHEKDNDIIILSCGGIFSKSYSEVLSREEFRGRIEVLHEKDTKLRNQQQQQKQDRVSSLLDEIR